MKILIYILIFVDGFDLCLTYNDNCEVNDLNALMVRLRQLRTEFHNLKEENEKQINANKEKIKHLKAENEKQATEIGKQATEIVKQATEILEMKAAISNKSTEIAEQAQEIARIKGLFSASMPAFVVRQKDVHYQCIDKIPFEIILLNVGNVFSNTTNHFTAPVAGLYMFTAQLCSHVDSSFDFSVYSHTHGRKYGASRNGKTSDHDCRSLTTLAKLTKNEEVYVHVVCPGSGQIEGHISDNFWTMFTGTLLAPEV